MKNLHKFFGELHRNTILAFTRLRSGVLKTVLPKNSLSKKGGPMVKSAKNRKLFPEFFGGTNEQTALNKVRIFFLVSFGCSACILFCCTQFCDVTIICRINLSRRNWLNSANKARLKSTLLVHLEYSLPQQ